MANGRRNYINPLANLTQTAKDLAYYLRYVNPNEVINTAEEIKKEYNAPRESWLTWPIYALLSLRVRADDLDRTIGAFQALTRKDRAIDEYAKQKPILTLIEKGGWEETSLNTNFLRNLVKKIPGYDASITLTRDEVIQLRKLLCTAFDDRLTAEERLTEQQRKLRQIDKAKSAKEKELFRKQAELLRKQEEVNEFTLKLADLAQIETSKDARLKEIEKDLKEYTEKVQLIAAEKALKESELQHLEQEKSAKESELEDTRKLLATLNPDFDMTGLDKAQKEEAVMVARVAFKTYKQQIEQQKNKKLELSSLGDLSLAKKTQDKVVDKKTSAPTAFAETRNKELAEMIQERKRHENPQAKSDFSSHLSLLFKMKSDHVKSTPKLVSSTLVAERQKELLAQGFHAHLLARTEVKDDYKDVVGTVAASPDTSEQAVSINRMK
jgi:chromosome segregation ATPase